MRPRAVIPMGRDSTVAILPRNGTLPPALNLRWPYVDSLGQPRVAARILRAEDIAPLRLALSLYERVLAEEAEGQSHAADAPAGNVVALRGR